MLSRQLLTAWFPAFAYTLSSEPTVQELAGHLEGTTVFNLMRQLTRRAIPQERIGVSQVPLREACIALAIDVIKDIPLCHDREYFRLTRTLMGVLCAWMSPPSASSMRRNRPVQELVTCLAFVNGLGLITQGKRLPHLDTLSRAFPPFLQEWYLTGDLSPAGHHHLAEYIEATLNAICNCHTDDMCYSIAAKHKFAYIGKAEAERKYSRTVTIGGISMRFPEHLGHTLFLDANPEYRYKVWSDYPIEDICLLPCRFGKTKDISKYEVVAIRAVRTQTQLSDLRAGPGILRSVEPREFPRFRERPSLPRQLELNLHLRHSFDDPLATEDVWCLKDWFRSFSLADEGLRSQFRTYVNNIPMTVIYALVLRMSVEKLRIPIIVIFSLPYPRLWVLKFWEVACSLVSTFHRRRAVQTIEYWISHWCRLTTYVMKFQYRDDPGEPSLRQIRSLLYGLFSDVMHPRYFRWIVYIMRKTRFVRQNSRTYADVHTNIAPHARMCTLREYCALTHAERDHARTWSSLEIYPYNWSCYLDPGRDTREAELSRTISNWVSHFRFPISDSEIQLRVHELYESVRAPRPIDQFGSRYRCYIAYFEKFALKQQELQGEFTLGPVDKNAKKPG